MKAFPTPAFSINNEARVTAVGGEGGMDLRDYFAAKAMQMEMQSTKKYYDEGECDVSCWSQLFVNIAEHAYLMADAMMEEREKKYDI
jgi:hypothetical protein